ncbi:protein of unknown function [Cupriavidus taiwanensis]|nr:hypothetical protein CBM2606_A90322 [Cupriavidus taiwanensis]SPA41789.1 protein of unknown function [Cupriavidus taiwanensis]
MQALAGHASPRIRAMLRSASDFSLSDQAIFSSSPARAAAPQRQRTLRSVLPANARPARLLII